MENSQRVNTVDRNPNQNSRPRTFSSLMSWFRGSNTPVTSSDKKSVAPKSHNTTGAFAFR